jgi:hypothetical protein
MGANQLGEGAQAELVGAEGGGQYNQRG